MRRVLAAAAAGTMVLLAGAVAGDGLAQGYDPMARRSGAARPPLPGARPPDPSENRPTVPLNAELGNLPDTPGAEETYYLCSACHSLAIVKQQRVTDAHWDYLWTWMVERQGMPEQDPETRETILSYLKQHFSSER